MRPGQLRFVTAAEAALLLLLLAIAAWQFWEWATLPARLEEPAGESLSSRVPAFDNSYLLIGVLIIAGLYGMIQFFGNSILALWVAGILTIVPQFPGIWAHNKLGWERFMGVETPVGDGHSLFLAGALFVFSMFGLFVLHRLIALRKLGGLLASKGVDAEERDSILTSEGMALTMVAVASLVLALVLVAAGTGLGRTQWITTNVPWTVVTIGGGASVLLIGFIALFLRDITAEGASEAHPEE